MNIDGATASLLGQVAALAGGIALGRYLRTKSLIALNSAMSGFLMMAAHIAYDGQGACILLLYGFLVYGLSVVGRPDLP